MGTTHVVSWRMGSNQGVAYKPRFGGGSQARTPQLVWASWRETQLGRDQLEGFSWTGTSYSHETSTRPKGFPMSISISSLPR
jgi:hypothetical protein